MYLKFYNLLENPFHITPDPGFLFLSPSHKEALGSIIYGIEQRKGFIAIIGEVGVGKTTVLRSYLDECDQQRQKIIYLFNASLSFQDLLQAVARQLGVELQSDHLPEMVERLHLALIEEYRQGNSVVLILDEAQNVPVETLENLRMLSNLETTRDKLIQIVLIGQPELQQKLDRHELRQLKQRIAIRSVILPLNAEESRAYILHRLARAGGGRRMVFTRGALQCIIREARGIPRVINILCDNALIAGMGYQRKPVDARIAREAIADFNGKARSVLRRRVAVGAAVVLVAGALAAFLAYERGGTHFSPRHVESLSPGPQPMKRSNIPEPAREPVLAKQVEPSGAAPLPGEEIRPSGAESAPLEESPPPVSAERVDPGVRTEAPGARLPPPEELPAPTGEAIPVKAPAPGDLIRIIEKGENLSTIILNTYGSVDPKLVDLVRRHNPHIRNVDRLLPGDRIQLPKAEQGRSGP